MGRIVFDDEPEFVVVPECVEPFDQFADTFEKPIRTCRVVGELVAAAVDVNITLDVSGRLDKFEDSTLRRNDGGTHRIDETEPFGIPEERVETEV